MKKKDYLWNLQAFLMSATFTFRLKISCCIVCLIAVIYVSAKNDLRLKSKDASMLGKAVTAFVVFDY